MVQILMKSTLPNGVALVVESTTQKQVRGEKAETREWRKIESEEERKRKAREKA